MVGTSVLHYRIVRQIGSGGMGVVYEAEDTKLHRQVALKFLPESMNESSEAAERFEREAQLAGGLNHPNICTVHDTGVHEGRPFFVMELLEGTSLRNLIASGALPTERVLEIGSQIADAMDAAHAKGVVHRDIKPGNIFITARGQAKLLDFGVASAGPSHVAAADDTKLADSLTTPGTAIGSVNYMSPEQARGETLDARTDLFSFGLVLYEMVTGRQAFGGQTTAVVFDAILNRDPIPVQQANPAVPADLTHLISRALEKDRRLRYQTAADMLSELNRLKRDTTAATVVAAAAAPATRGASRGLWIGLPVAGVLAIAAFFFWQSQSTPAFEERDTIVIADFENTTGDPVFDDALRQAVAVQLQQTPFVTLLADQSVERALRLMSRPPDQPMTSAVTREVCQRAGARASVEGSIAPLGQAYVITIGVHNCQTGASLAQEQVQASSKEEVLTQVGSALTSLRRGLGESLASIEQYDVPITDATTASLDALKAYGQAVRVRRLRGDEPSIPFFEQAIDLDPEFALAYAKAGVANSNIGREEDARKYTEKAYALRDKVSEYERLYITWSYASHVTRDVAQATKTLEMMSEAYPRDFTARNNLGVQLMGLARFDEALEQYQMAHAIAPDEPLPVSNTAYAMLALGRYEEGYAEVDRALAMRPNSGLANTRWVLARMNGDSRAAEFEKVARDLATPTQILFAESALAVWDGRLADYSRVIEQLRSQMRANDPEAVQGLDAAELTVMARLQGGTWLERLQAFARQPLPPQGAAQIAAALAEIGDMDAVRRLDPQLGQVDLNDVEQARPAVIARALRAASEGRATEAEAMINDFIVQSPRGLDMHYYLGLIRERQGDTDGAIASYRKAIEAASFLGPRPELSYAKLALALLLKKKGDPGADALVADLEKQWANADPGFGPLRVLKENK